MKFRTACIFGASFVIFTSIAILFGKPPAEKLDLGLSMREFCQKYNYSLEDETVTTEDGYILTMHRISKLPFNTVANKSKTKRSPVLILHGVLGSSADFVAAREQSLAFQLADKGYDVWLGNTRGNTYSRNHVMIDPDEEGYFWDFSFHEHGVYDLPTMIDHILEKTRFPNLTFVGMSQGAVSFLVMNSLKLEYNKKVNLANLLAPVTTFYPTKSIVFQTVSFFNYFIEKFFYYWGHFEIFGDSQYMTKILRYACLGPHKIANYFCIDQILRHGIGFSDQKNYDIFPFHVSVTPAGASTKQLLHMVQNRRSGKFAPFDYYDKNEAVYNQDTVPEYNISLITTPVAAYFGKSDIFVSAAGLHRQLRQMPNVVLRHRVPYDKFNHMDFIYAKDLNFLVNNKLIETIDKYNRKK